jgi:cytochrome b6-f complex iron-sulfur subunit
MTLKSEQSTVDRPRISRRELLTYAWISSLAALTLGGLAAFSRFMRPRSDAGASGSVFDLGTLADLPAAGTAPLNYPEGGFWLVRSDAGLLALRKSCAHLNCLYDWDAQSSQFVCPCHGSLFAADGSHLEGPAARSLDRFVVRLTGPDGRILAETDPSGVPVGLPPGNSDIRVSVDTGRKIPGPPT